MRVKITDRVVLRSRSGRVIVRPLIDEATVIQVAEDAANIASAFPDPDFVIAWNSGAELPDLHDLSVINKQALEEADFS